MAMGRPRSFDADEALGKAMDVFWRRGYEGASLVELTKAMGINPPSLYAAFGNKEGLFRAALDLYSKKRGVFMAEVMAAPTAREVLDRLLHGMADLFTDPEAPPGCLVMQSGTACSTTVDPVTQEIVARRRAGELALRERLERAREEGDLPQDVEPLALARYAAGLVQGMSILASSGATRQDLHDVANVALRCLPENAVNTVAAPEMDLAAAH
jgi:AcrR family transcriptional regulator